MSKLTKKVAAVGLSVTTAVWLMGAGMLVPVSVAEASLTDSQIESILNLLESFGADTATVSNVNSALRGLATSGTGGAAVSCSFSRSLTLGSTGDDVKCLQQYLNAAGHTLAASGVGSPGNETSYFGPLTRTAVASWQAANDVSPAVGYFGPISQAKYGTVGAGVGTGTGTGTGTGAIVVVPVGTDLVVQAASDSPLARTIGSGTAFNPALKIALTAGAASVSINSITLKKNGFLTNTNLNGVDVVDSSGTRHGNVVTSINADDTILITMTSDPVTVSAGTTEYLTIRFNLLTGNYTGTVGFALQSISSDASSVSASFPITGATMNLVDGGSSLASTTLDVLTSTGSSTLNVDPNSLQEITRFRIVESGSKEGAYLHSLTLYNYGNADEGDYKDVTLEATDGTVLATTQPSGQNVVFNLATPYFIDKGQTKDFTIKAKLIGGTTKTIELVVYNNYDIDLRGSSTGISVIPGNGSTDTSFPVGNGYNKQTIGSGSLTLTRASDSPSSAVTPGATSVLLAKYTAKPTGESYELRQVSFGLDQDDVGSVSLSGTVVMKVNGVIVFSEGISSWDVDGTVLTKTLSSYPVLTAGEDSTIEFVVSISSSATASDSYFINDFDFVQAKRLVTNDLVDPTTVTLDGLIIAINSGSLVVTTLATPVANSVVVGTNNFEFATIQLNAQASGEDIKVTKIIVTDTLVAGAYSHVTNLLMYKDSETSPLPTSASTATNGNEVTFSFSTPVLVTKSTPVTLHLMGDVTNSTSTHTFNVSTSTASALTAVGATTGNSLTHGSDITFAGNGQAQAIVTTGNLTISLLSGSGASPSITQVKAVGTSDEVVFAFKMTSQFEAQKITSLKLTATGTALATTTLSNIRLFEGSNSTAVASAPQFDTCDGTTCEITFTASDNILNNPVPVAGVNIYVKADISAAGIAILGNDFKFKINSIGDVKVKGAVTASTSGTIAGTPEASASTHIVPSIVTVAADSPTVATQVGTGSGQKIAVFKVTNNGSFPIYLATSTDAITFSNGGSASTSLTFALYASAAGGTNSDTTVPYRATSTSFGTSTTIPFDMTLITAANTKIDGGSWRYLTVKTNGVAANNDTFQLAVSALGSIKYKVWESDYGFYGNAGTTLSDLIIDLYTDGTPSLETVTAKN